MIGRDDDRGARRVSRAVRRRLTYANVMSTIAVFGVLGGGAWAAGKITSKDIAKDAVLSKQIKNGTIESQDLAKGAVTAKQVKLGSLSPGHVKNLVATPAGNSSAVTGEPSVELPYPLQGASWTQAGSQLELLTGTVRFTTPPACVLDGTPGQFGNGRVRVKLGGNAILAGYLSPLPADTARTTTLSVAPDIQGGGGPALLQRPGDATPRTLTATIEDNCETGNFTVQSIAVDVIGIG